MDIWTSCLNGTVSFSSRSVSLSRTFWLVLSQGPWFQPTWGSVVARQLGKYVMLPLAEEHGADLPQYRPLLFHGKEFSFMSGTTATLSTIGHSKCFCCISEQQCRTSLSCLCGLYAFVIWQPFRPSCLRAETFASSTVRFQQSSLWIVHARSCQRCPFRLRSVSPGHFDEQSTWQRLTGAALQCTILFTAKHQQIVLRLPCGIGPRS